MARNPRSRRRVLCCVAVRRPGPAVPSPANARARSSGRLAPHGVDVAASFHGTPDVWCWEGCRTVCTAVGRRPSPAEATNLRARVGTESARTVRPERGWPTVPTLSRSRVNQPVLSHIPWESGWPRWARLNRTGNVTRCGRVDGPVLRGPGRRPSPALPNWPGDAGSVASAGAAHQAGASAALISRYARRAVWGRCSVLSPSSSP